MKFYVGTCTIASETPLPHDWCEQLEPITEQLGNRVAMQALSSGRMLGSSLFDNESGSYSLKFGVYVKDVSLTTDEIIELVAEGLAWWDLQQAGEIELQPDVVHKTLPDLSFFRDRHKASKVGLSELTRLLRKPEFLVDEISHMCPQAEEAFERARTTRYATALSEELTRIYDQPGQPGVIPVAYLVHGYSAAVNQDAIRGLVGALRASGRLTSGHIFTFDLDKTTSLCGHLLANLEESLTYFNESLREAVRGSTCIIKYGQLDHGHTFNGPAQQVLQRMVELLYEIRNDTQIIFVIPDGKDDIEAMLRREYNAHIVALRPDPIPDRRADFADTMQYLRKRAAKDQLQVDDALEDAVRAMDEDQRIRDADEIYNAWRDQKLVDDVYPQYRDASLTSKSSTALVETDPWKQLNNLIGLESVKAHIKREIDNYRYNAELQRRGLRSNRPTLHTVFRGAPGTGKTEVATCYGKILKHEGLLSSGRVITVSGGQARNIDALFDQAAGSILFIDEAYAIIPTQIADLIARMESDRDRTVVILAGYEEHIDRLIDSNPGFRSRIGSIIDFPDYSVDELTEIFQLMASNLDLILPPETITRVRDILARAGAREDQGNARYVRNIFERALKCRTQRFKSTDIHQASDQELQTLLPADIQLDTTDNGDKDEAVTTSARERLANLIGLDSVKQLVADQINFMRIQKEKRDRGLRSEFHPMHMVFTGNPGTGKTEVARLIAKILKDEGILSVGELYECGRQDLVAPYVGHTAPKVHSLFRKAKGSVIFIDEAYSLANSPGDSFGNEAITTLIDDMEKFREEVVVILAGYSEEMRQLMDTNPGFRSRVKFHVDFPDYTPDELLQILHHFAKRSGLILANGVDERVYDILQHCTKTRESGNARFVRTLFENAQLHQSSRLRQQGDPAELSDEHLGTLEPDDFQALEDRQKQRPIGFVPNR